MRCFQKVFERGAGFSVAGRLVPVPVSAGRRAGTPRRTPSGQRTGWLAVLMGLFLLAASGVCTAQSDLPPGVPNIHDPAVRAQFVAVAVWPLHGNPDFPMLLLVNTAGQSPTALLLGVDARNGKDTWSLVEDPIVLIGVFGTQRTMQAVYADSGFVGRGAPSGHYTLVDDANSPTHFDVLRAFAAAIRRTRI